MVVRGYLPVHRVWWLREIHNGGGMSKITYTKHGIVTSDPQIAAMFLHKFLTQEGWLSAVFEESRFQLDYVGGESQYPKEITIPYPLVADAIKPVEGEAVIIIWPDYEDDSSPNYKHTCTATDLINYPEAVFLSANSFTAGHTVGELRELIARVNAGESQEG